MEGLVALLVLAPQILQIKHWRESILADIEKGGAVSTGDGELYLECSRVQHFTVYSSWFLAKKISGGGWTYGGERRHTKSRGSERCFYFADALHD